MLNFVRLFDFTEKLDLIPMMTDDLMDDFLKASEANQLQIFSIRKDGMIPRRFWLHIFYKLTLTRPL